MREFHYTWTYDLNSPPEALWPLVSDTNRFNRDTLLPPVELLGIEKGVRHVRYKFPIIAVEWDEEPFEWVYPHRFGILRRYRKGPLTEMRVDCRLERREPNGTRLIYQAWVRPANPLGVLGIPLAIGFASARLFEQAYHRYDEILSRGDRTLVPSSGRNLSPGGRSRLEVQGKLLMAQGTSADLLVRLTEFLERADEISVQRIRPYALADAWGVERRPVLEMCLRATRLGLMDMYWELLCPECRGTSEGHGHLSELNAHSHCKTCNIDFTANFDHNVEVVFRPNPSVRTVSESLEFCVGSPQRQPHVVLSMIVPAGEELPLRTVLDAGRYTLKVDGLRGSQALIAAPNGADTLVIEAASSGWPSEETPISLTPYLKLVNHTGEHHTFDLVRTEWSDQASTAADVTNLQVFRDLFSSEVLRPGEEISVGSVTLMFTDLRESTKLYRQIGDATAFGRVREHFDVLEKSVAGEGGALIKTMGDSVMAVFRHPAQALRAIRIAQMRLSDREPRLWLKAGIHVGPCIVVNLNQRLDYFGSTVNLAARLPDFSSGGEIIFSEAIRHDPDVAAFLRQDVAPNALSPFHAEVRGLDEPMQLWKMKL